MPQMRPKKLNLPDIEVDTKNPTIIKQEKAKRKEEKLRKKKFRIIRNTILIIIGILIVATVGTYIYLYSTNAFKIENVKITGVAHLTDDEMNQLIDMPQDTTLLKVDTDVIKKRLKRDAWIQDVNIVLDFPNTLVINVIERPITAIVEVPTSSADMKSSTDTTQDSIVRNWAISADHIWLMPVPDRNSETASKINQQIYADAEGVMHIVDVSPSVQPEIGSVCTDEAVNNAIDVVAAMTTDLKGQVKNVKATDANSTNLILTNGVEIAVGTSENLREKERVCQELLEKYEGKISYINVRNANNPTWRSL